MSTWRRSLALTLSVAMATLCASVRATAQSASATMGVSALVDVALTGIAMQNLAFGTTIPGSSTTVTPGTAAGCTGCTAGWWQSNTLSNAKQANRAYMQITFTSLPSTLTRISGTETIAVDWTNAAEACLEKNGSQYYCYTAWTPVQGTMHSVHINPDPTNTKGTRLLDIYLGGTISPSASQRAGNYYGTVTLQIAYGSF